MSAGVVRRASVRVPATTANLGAGFDCVGLAVDRWLEVSVELRVEEGAVTFRRDGTLCELDRAGISDEHEDLIYRGFEQTELQCRGGRGLRGGRGSLHFAASSDIPIGKGLGSSAAALVAGAALANEIFGLLLSSDDLAQVCARIEGHGDNVGAAVNGGAILVTPNTNGAHFVPIPVHESLGFAFVVPDFETRTARARAALPSRVAFETAVGAAARSAALVCGLQTADRALLTAGLDDVLHVPHRKSLVPQYDRVVNAARAAGAIGATLSGSGSSIVAIGPRDAMASVAANMVSAWCDAGVEAHGLSTGVCPTGLTVVKPAYQHTSQFAYHSLHRSIACP